MFRRFGVGSCELSAMLANTFGVGRLLHLFFSHASHPPSSTNTSGSCASLRRRRATSRLALQLRLLQYTTTFFPGDHTARNCGSDSFQRSSFNESAPGT